MYVWHLVHVVQHVQQQDLLHLLLLLLLIRLDISTYQQKEAVADCATPSFSIQGEKRILYKAEIVIKEKQNEVFVLE